MMTVSNPPSPAITESDEAPFPKNYDDVVRTLKYFLDIGRPIQAIKYFRNKLDLSYRKELATNYDFINEESWRSDTTWDKSKLITAKDFVTGPFKKWVDAQN